MRCGALSRSGSPAGRLTCIRTSPGSRGSSSWCDRCRRDPTNRRNRPDGGGAGRGRSSPRRADRHPDRDRLRPRRAADDRGRREAHRAPSTARPRRASSCSSTRSTRPATLASGHARRPSLGRSILAGRLTIVLDRRTDAQVPESLGGGRPTLGLRLPDHEVPRALARTPRADRRQLGQRHRASRTRQPPTSVAGVRSATRCR